MDLQLTDACCHRYQVLLENCSPQRHKLMLSSSRSEDHAVQIMVIFMSGYCVLSGEGRREGGEGGVYDV